MFSFQNKQRALVTAGIALLVLLSPAAAFAGGGGDGASGLVTTAIFHLINLVALVGAVIYLARGQVRKALEDRKKQITSDLEEAKRLREEARALLEKYDHQLATLDSDRDAVLAEYRQIGEAERDRIIKEAQSQADKMAQDAERTIEGEVARARTALESEVVRLAAGMAERMIVEKMSAERDNKLIEHYLSDLEQELQA